MLNSDSKSLGYLVKKRRYAIIWYLNMDITHLDYGDFMFDSLVNSGSTFNEIYLGYQECATTNSIYKKGRRGLLSTRCFFRSFPPKDEVYSSFQENASSYLGAFQIPSYPYPYQIPSYPYPYPYQIPSYPYHHASLLP